MKLNRYGDFCSLEVVSHSNFIDPFIRIIRKLYQCPFKSNPYSMKTWHRLVLQSFHTKFLLKIA